MAFACVVGLDGDAEAEDAADRLGAGAVWSPAQWVVWGEGELWWR